LCQEMGSDTDGNFLAARSSTLWATKPAWRTAAKKAVWQNDDLRSKFVSRANVCRATFNRYGHNNKAERGAVVRSRRIRTTQGIQRRDTACSCRTLQRPSWLRWQSCGLPNRAVPGSGGRVENGSHASPANGTRQIPLHLRFAASVARAQNLIGRFQCAETQYI